MSPGTSVLASSKEQGRLEVWGGLADGSGLLWESPAQNQVGKVRDEL